MACRPDNEGTIHPTPTIFFYGIFFSASCRGSRIVVVYCYRHYHYHHYRYYYCYNFCHFLVSSSRQYGIVTKLATKIRFHLFLFFKYHFQRLLWSDFGHQRGTKAFFARNSRRTHRNGKKNAFIE